MSTQHETPKTPYDRDLDPNESITFIVQGKVARQGYLRALADRAAELAALQGVRGPKCEHHKRYYVGPSLDASQGHYHCPDCKDTGHQPLGAGSVAELIRAAQAIDAALEAAANEAPEKSTCPFCFGWALHDIDSCPVPQLRDALAAFDLDEVTP